ncbi:isoprenoid synthase domain-containing protein [Podospora appendiculata]|uniref:Terpene synthase n=1 Tax=Podospora appendiculata TaxID=314037 RepID=A0AAE0XLY5_9PEZI|nr:isoprenoid synthase domain-containing protein [Podospora appendiculata]
MSAEIIRVPDFLRDWPWQRSINPLYEQVRTESEAWVRSFGILNPKSQAAFDRCKIESDSCDLAKLAALSYSYHDRTYLRLGTDLMFLLYLHDEQTDVEDADTTRKLGDIFIDALRNPAKPRPQGEAPIGEIGRQFSARLHKAATPTALTHFLDEMEAYIYSVVDQSTERQQNHIRSIADYFALRRLTGAGLPSFALIEAGMHIPEDVFRHPLLARMREAAAISLCFTNDVYSYNVERAKGHALHNLIPTVMHEKGLPLQSAIDWIGAWHDEHVVAEFLACQAELEKLTFGSADVDRLVRLYVHGLACWIRGADDWSFECERYFGREAAQVREERVVRMFPAFDVARADVVETEGEKGLVRELVEKGVAGLQIEMESAAGGVLVQ